MKGLSEAIGIWEVMHETMGIQPAITLYVDSSACKGMVLRHGVGKVKHLTTKQIWVQGAVQVYGVEVVKVPREQNVADMLTHDVPKGWLRSHGVRMYFDLGVLRLQRLSNHIV